MIFFNGGTGSLGRYFAPAVAKRNLQGFELRSRLEDRASLRAELRSYGAATPLGSNVCLVQMAAKVSVPACENDKAGAQKTNVTDTVDTVADFVTWARERGLAPSVLYVSSGHVYASQPEGSRISESDPVAPRSEYARTKLAAETKLAVDAAERGYPLVVARVFGLIAPQQPTSYMLQGLIRRVREGNLAGVPGLSFFRDMLDARDVCAHLVHLCGAGFGVQSGQTLVLNVCSGEPVQLREIVLTIVGAVDTSGTLGLASFLTEAPGRADDVPWIVGSPKLLETRLGVSARSISLLETIRDALALA